MTRHAVLIAGGGPTGLMLAAELALAGADVAIIERRADQGLAGARAGGLHARTIEILDQRGVADRFLAEGALGRAAQFAGISLDLGGLPTRHPYVLALWQSHVERVLADWVAELGVPVHRGREVTGFVQDGDGVDVETSDGGAFRADYLVGCDGGRSAVRKAAGVAFPGSAATVSNLIAEVELAEQPPEWGVRRDALGIHSLSRSGDGALVRVLVTEGTVGGRTAPTLQDLRAALTAAYGTDFGAHSPVWISRFTDAARQAETYRRGRVLLAGDAAHIHPPDGGQGLQTGAQDAVNLGWKLAQVVRGVSSDSLLDTYHAERHPVGARVVRNALAAVTLRRADDRTTALRGLMADAVDAGRLAATVAGLDIRYDLGGDHPLVGRRAPDLDIVVEDRETSVFALLRDARPTLINFGEPGRFDATPRSARVRVVNARCKGDWDLPVVGRVAAPPAVLIRPDGHAAWVGESDDPSLAEALTFWFGPSTRRGPA